MAVGIHVKSPSLIFRPLSGRCVLSDVVMLRRQNDWQSVTSRGSSDRHGTTLSVAVNLTARGPSSAQLL